jgi:LysM repeat protein
VQDIRRITPNSARQEYSLPAPGSVPVNTVPQPASTYTRTSVRQSNGFEPIKPEIPPNVPIVSFAPPKQNPAQQPAVLQQPPMPQQSMITQAGVRQIETPVAPVDDSPTRQPAAQSAVERFIQSQQQLIDSGNPKNIRLAFVQASQLYEHKQLNDLDRVLMRPLLDSLALKVIYARDTHILEPAYRVKPGETLESIAKDFNLSPVLLRKINGITASELPAGTVLKVVFGQFDAKISMKRKELTLLLGGLYAGRFSFSLLNDTGVLTQSGEFYVTHRTDQAITLNNGLTLSTTHAKNTHIAFSDQDAREIFDILSEQSVIVLE